jgi:hypothetical protein
MTLTARALPPHSFGHFIASRTTAVVGTVPGCLGTLCVGGEVGRFVGPGEVVAPGALGTASLGSDLDAMPTPSGFVAATPVTTWCFQLWYRETSPAGTTNLTDAVAMTLL